MNTTDRKQTKRVMVDLFGHETLLKRRRIVVEMPAESDAEALKDIGGRELDEILTQQQMSDEGWETEESECFETLDGIYIAKDEVPERLEADIVLEFGRNDQLVAAEVSF